MNPDLTLQRPIFRGFVGGNAFITKKGYRGLKIDSLWVQNIFESFKLDDEELAVISLQSSIADLQDVVTGGLYGSPYSIGDYGFYSEKQFEVQLEHLKEKARKSVLSSNSYLSVAEWKVLDEKLSTIAHHGKALFVSTCRGDTFAALAIKQCAFQVAKIFMNSGIDPLLENELGKDLFDVAKEQYQVLNLRLKEVQDFKSMATSKVIVPSVVVGILNQECILIDQFHFLSDFAEDMKLNLIKRLEHIEAEKIEQRRSILRNEEFPLERLHNIQRQSKAENYLLKLDELKRFIVEKITFHERHAKKFVNLADLLHANYDLINSSSSVSSNNKLDSKNSDVDSNDGGGRSSTYDNNNVTSGNFSNCDIDELSISESTSKVRLPAISNNNSSNKYKLQYNSNSNIISSKQQKFVTKLEESALLSTNGDSVSEEAADSATAHKDQDNVDMLTPITNNYLASTIAARRSSVASTTTPSVKSSTKTATAAPLSRTSTPGDKLRASMAAIAAPVMSSKHELFTKLGVTSDLDNYVDAHTGKADKPSMSKSSLARSQKDQYLPIIGTFKQTDDAVIMYR